MRDQPGVQEVADFGGVAPARVLVVVGDEIAQRRGVPLFGGCLGLFDQRANLVLGCSGGAAAGAGERDDERKSGVTQGASPIAAGCP